MTKHWVLPAGSIVLNFHMSSRCSQDPQTLASHILCLKGWGSRSESAPYVTLRSCPLLALGDVRFLPLTFHFLFEGWCPKLHSRGLHHRICRGWENRSDLEQPWLNNCVNIVEIHGFFQMKTALHSQGGLDAFRRPRNPWVVPWLLQSCFVFCFFSAPSSLILILFRTEIPGLEILPIPTNMAFWPSQETERKSNVITQPLKFNHVVIHQRFWRWCTFLKWNVPSERLLCRVAFMKKERAVRREFHTRTKACTVTPIYLCSLEPCWYHCVWISSVSSLFFSSSFIFAVILETIYPLPVFSSLITILKIIFKY